MKITIVGTAYPFRGGIAHSTALLTEYLRKRHTVELVTFKRQYPAFLFPGKTQREVGMASQHQAALQLIDSINPLNWIRVARFLRRDPPDLLVVRYWIPFFGPCFGTIAKLVKRRTKTRVLFICDNVIPHERRPGDMLFTRYALRQADMFVVLSEAVERDLVRLFPGAVHRCAPHPVYESFGSPVPKHEARRALQVSAEKIMLFFGYVRPYKGLMVLLDAMARVRDSGLGAGKIMLLVVGEFYESEKTYRDRVRELALDPIVRFVTEYVPNEQVASYFSAADVVVLPYRSATQSGIVQIAYNFDRPVITSNIGGLAEVVNDGQTGLLVPPDDPESLARAIIRFYRKGMEQNMSARIGREKEKYSWDNLAHAIEELASMAR